VCELMRRTGASCRSTVTVILMPEAKVDAVSSAMRRAFGPLRRARGNREITGASTVQALYCQRTLMDVVEQIEGLGQKIEQLFSETGMASEQRLEHGDGGDVVSFKDEIDPEPFIDQNQRRPCGDAGFVVPGGFLAGDRLRAAQSDLGEAAQEHPIDLFGRDEGRGRSQCRGEAGWVEAGRRQGLENRPLRLCLPYISPRRLWRCSNTFQVADVLLQFLLVGR